MTGVQTLLARAALGCVAAAATVALSRFRSAFTWSEERFRRRYLLAFTGIRLLLFSLVFLVLRIAPRGDLPGIYISEFRSRLAGGVPYRDYPSSYAPLFSYLCAPVYRLHSSPLTVILFSILVEILTAFVFLRCMPRILPEREARLAALLCLVNPISLQFVTIDGQNNVLIALAVAMALLWITERREALSGVALGLSIASVKFLPLLFTPLFPLFLRRRAAAWIAGCAAVVAIVYGWFTGVLRAPVLQALQREGDMKSAGGLPFLVEAATGHDFGKALWDGLLLLALAAVLAVGVGLARRTPAVGRAAWAAMTFLMPALLLTMMALGKKTWPTYTEMVLFPLAMVMATTQKPSRDSAGKRLVAAMFGAFSLLSVITHSIWASLLNQATALATHALLRDGHGIAWLLMLLEAGLFAGYASLAWLCLRQAGRVTPNQG